MSYPHASTPMPSVHRAAGSDLNQLAFTAGQLEAIGQQLLQGFLHQVALALLGAASGNLGALRALLNTWAQGLDATASNLEALLVNAAQGTAAELGAAISGSVGAIEGVITGAGVTIGDDLASAGSEVGGIVSGSASSLVDAAENAFGGAAAATTVFGQGVAAGLGAVYGAWTGQATTAAAAMLGGASGLPSLAGAALQAAQAQAAQAQQTLAIQAQLPHFYGGSGTAETSVQTTFPSDGSLPPGFSAVSTVAHATLGCATSAETDSQTVSAIWSVTDANPKYLILRANAGFTSYTYAKLYPGFTFVAGGEVPVTNVDICAVVAGVQTTFTTIQLPSPKFGSGAYGVAAVANQTYLFEAVDYTLTITGNDGTGSFTDTSHVSQVGADYRYGGIGTDDTTAPAGENVYSFVFYDSGPTAGPATVYVATQESTQSTTYTDLATTSDEVTVNIGASGMAIVFISAQIVSSNSVGYSGYVGFAMSGANSVAAGDAYAISINALGTTGQNATIGAPFLLTGLSPGATSFKMKYRSSSTAPTFNFANRRISVIPL